MPDDILTDFETEDDLRAIGVGELDPRHYRAFVGIPWNYDRVGASVFNLLCNLGLRDVHHVLDIGCGSLRVGRLLIPYLLPGRYFGIEPNMWLVREGIRWELGQDLVKFKQPIFSANDQFDLSVFDQQFDFILANSILSHACKREAEALMGQLASALKPQGIFLATFVVGDSDYEEDEWHYPQTIAYTPDYIKLLCARHGMAFFAVHWTYPTLYPENQMWFAVTQRNVVLTDLLENMGWGAVRADLVALRRHMSLY